MRSIRDNYMVGGIKFIRKAEKGDEEIDKGRYKTLDYIRKKYNHA